MEQLLKEIIAKLGSMDSENKEFRNEVTKTLNSIKEQVVLNSESIHILQDDVTTLKDNQTTIMHIQQDQQKILERLSIRSISHEADIAEIRRIK